MVLEFLRGIKEVMLGKKKRYIPIEVEVVVLTINLLPVCRILNAENSLERRI